MDPQVLAVILTLGGGALIGAISYTLRTLYGWRIAKQLQQAELINNLHRLAALLRTSKSLFDAQADRRNKLNDLLKINHKKEFALHKGYEAKFTKIYEHFTVEERELHGIVRTMTENALRPVNEAISSWLEQDIVFKTACSPLRKPRNLAELLQRLELHMMLWHAKYKYWMVDPRHALCYLADEEDHGIGFPTDIEAALEDALIELGQPKLPAIPQTSGAS